MVDFYRMTSDGPKAVASMDGDNITGDRALVARLRQEFGELSDEQWERELDGSYLFALVRKSDQPKAAKPNKKRPVLNLDEYEHNADWLRHKPAKRRRGVRETVKAILFGE